jgi:hypothetical protein
MKKVFFAIIASAAISFTSCKKCTTCTYEYVIYSNGMPYKYTYTYPEQCGKRKEINDYIKACKDSADLVNGATCTCTNK